MKVLLNALVGHESTPTPLLYSEDETNYAHSKIMEVCMLLDPEVAVEGYVEKLCVLMALSVRQIMNIGIHPKRVTHIIRELGLNSVMSTEESLIPSSNGESAVTRVLYDGNRRSPVLIRSIELLHMPSSVANNREDLPE